MAEGNSNTTPAKDTKAKATAAKSTTEKAKTATAAKETPKDDKSLALSVQPQTLLPQNRPIEPSNMEIVNTYSSVGSNRPVSKGKVEFNSSLVISGNRPIAASSLQISDSYVVMGNRPVASNESDETASLMGYLD